MVVLNELGMLPPNDEKLEGIVLGALLIDSNAYSRVYALLEPNTFYNKKNRIVFEAIVDLAKERTGIDMITVTEKLKTKGLIEEVSEN